MEMGTAQPVRCITVEVFEIVADGDFSDRKAGARVCIYGQGRGVLILMSGELSVRTASNESHSQQGQKQTSMCVCV